MEDPDPYYLLNPDLANIRKRALKALSDDMDALLVTAGYLVENQQKTIWVRRSRVFTTYVQIQKSDTGGACYINFGRERPFYRGKVPTYANNTNARLQVLAEGRLLGDRFGRLRYHLLEGDSPLRDEVITLLREQALPVLRQMHSLRTLGMRWPPTRL